MGDEAGLGLTERMRGDVPGSRWPALFSTKSASLAALLLQLEQSQWLPDEVVAARQRTQLAALAMHFATHSARFRERLAAAGLDPPDLAGQLAELPPLTRREAQRDPQSLFCDVLPEGHGPTHVLQTSGSTGEPVKVRKTAANQLFWLALTLRYHLWQEPDFSGRLAAVRALMPDPAAHADWGAPITAFFATGPSLRLDNGIDLGAQIEALRAFRPTSLIIYPNNLAALLDRMDAEGFDLPGLARVRTIAETLPPELRERAAARLGATVRDCYSSEEFGYLAIECPAGELYHVMAETVLVEIVDEEGRACKPGETGRVVVTDLQNHATPMIRYAIGDYAEVGPPCACGRGLPTLRRILGRSRNMVMKPDGSAHWPVTGFKRFRDIAPIVQYQMIQHTPTDVEVRLVAEEPLTAAQEHALGERIRSFLGHPFEIRFTYFEDRLPVGRNGKFEEFMCLVNR